MLGSDLDPQLTFTKHVRYVRSKIIGKVELPSKCTPRFGVETSVMLYKSLLLPVIEYCDVVYTEEGCCTVTASS